MSNGKAVKIHLIAGLMKKTLYKMSQYFPKPYEPFEGDINAKVHLSNYATKTELRKATEIDTSNLALKSNLAKLKAEVDKIDLCKSKNNDVTLSKLSDILNNEVIKKNYL